MLSESTEVEVESLIGALSRYGTVAMTVLVVIVGVVSVGVGANKHGNLDERLGQVSFLSYQTTTLPVLLLVWGLFSALFACALAVLVLRYVRLLKSNPQLRWGLLAGGAVLFLAALISTSMLLANSEDDVDAVCAAQWPSLTPAEQQQVNAEFACCGWTTACSPAVLVCSATIPPYVMSQLGAVEGCAIVLTIFLLVTVAIYELYRRKVLAVASHHRPNVEELEGLAQNDDDDDDDYQ